MNAIVSLKKKIIASIEYVAGSGKYWENVKKYIKGSEFKSKQIIFN